MAAVPVNTTIQTQIANLYIAILGRNPEPAGFGYWCDVLANAGGTQAALNAITVGFSNSPEFVGTYGGQTTEAAITLMYQNVLDRAPDAAGLAYWVGQANSLIGTYTVAQALALTGNNIITAAAANTGTADQTLIEAKEETAITAGTSAPTTTYTLTTSPETISGSNITVNGLVEFGAGAANSTLQAADSLTGVSGNNTLNITTVGTATDATNGALITGFGTANIRATGTTTLNAGLINGLTTVNSNLSTAGLTVTNLAAGATAAITGNGTLTNGATSFTYVDGATAATLNVKGGTTAGTVALVGAGVTATTINSTGAANIIGAVTGVATSKSLTINATTGLTTGNISGAALKTITVTGAASVAATPVTPAANDITSAVQLGTLADSVTTVDASAMTAGGVAVALNTAVTSFKGGAGTDTVTTQALTLTTASIIDAGAGTDVLRIRNTTDVNTAAKGSQYAGFETIDVGAQTVNMSNFANSTFTAVRVGGNATLTNMTTTQAANVTVYADSSANFGVKGATTVGQIDTLSLTVNDSLATKSTIVLADIVAAGVEIFNINAVENVTLSAFTQLATMTNMTVTGGGNVSLTTGANAAVLNATIDASAVTGTFTLNAVGATANGLLVTGSATGVNTLTGSNVSTGDKLVGGAAADVIKGLTGTDVITGGAGIDQIFGNRGADTLTGGDGNDVFTIRTGDSYTYATQGTLGAETITPVASNGNGIISYNYTINGITVAGTVGTAGTTATATEISDAIRATIAGNVELSSYLTASGTATVVLTAAQAPISTVLVSISTAGVGTAPTGAVTFTTDSTASSGALTTDSITDLNLGGTTLATQVDSINLTGLTASALTVVATSAMTGADLTTAANALFAVGGALNGTTNAVGIFTYGTDSYLVGNVGASGTAFGSATAVTSTGSLLNASDFIVKITGFQGTLDASDFTFVA